MVDNLENVLNELNINEIVFQNLLDTTGDTSIMYGAKSIPMSIFISPEGIVTANIIGPMEESEIIKQLETANGH